MKIVVGMHNPKVAGSNPAPATSGSAFFVSADLFFAYFQLIKILFIESDV